MVGKLLILLSLLSPVAHAKTLTIAVIDTGFGFRGKAHDIKLCKYGHKDFTSQGMYSLSYGTVTPVPTDLHGHGTNIAGGIRKFAKNADYCIVVLKFYRQDAKPGESVEASERALRHALNIKADFINYSGGGKEFSSAEKKIIVQFLDSGGTLVSAAGNEYENLDLPGKSFYPAMYDKRIVVVGNGKNGQDRLPSSNYGSVVTRWEVGTVDMYGYSMSGTSQSTAIATGKLINERSSKSKRNRNTSR